MPKLKENPTLQDFQNYVLEMEKERGFTNNTVLQNSLMLGEEVGELFKAIRKSENMKMDPQASVGKIEEELADIFIYLCSISNRYDVDLEEAFQTKENQNVKRTWK